MSCWEVISSDAYKSLPDDKKMDLLVSVQKACNRAVSRYKANESDQQFVWLCYAVAFGVIAFLCGAGLIWWLHGAVASCIVCLVSFFLGIITPSFLKGGPSDERVP